MMDGEIGGDGAGKLGEWNEKSQENGQTIG